jgi:hypothetical protein
MTKWAEVCKHIVMHYNDGWNNGYHYNITYWEIWNEPDLDGFWDGTADEYYTLYHTIVQTLKAYNPSLKIGGPCTSSIADTNFTHGFLTYLVNNEIPLDFYSWHHYADTPHDLYTSSRTVRNLLDSYGFADCALNVIKTMPKTLPSLPVVSLHSKMQVSTMPFAIGARRIITG